MTFIITSEEDSSTNGVIDWLFHNKKQFIRVNPSNLASNITIDEEQNVFFKIHEKRINLNEVDSFWYRRGKLNLEVYEIKDNTFPLQTILNRHLQIEVEPILELILTKLKAKNSLGDYYNTDVNKFIMLQKAKDAGLQIPASIVTCNKEDVAQFAKRQGNIITKSLNEMIMAFHDSHSIMSYTQRLSLSDIESLPDNFSPSLFQNEIEKKFELRIFYLDGECYSMAIFSQFDQQTTIDFRVYNVKKPNRCVPYKLPAVIENKIKTFMARADLTTGSIDMIYSQKKEYIFLEVNPIGQFDMVSFPCNYHLQKQIADYLS